MDALRLVGTVRADRVPAAMFGVFWAYAQKSAKENTKGGIVYDMNIRQAETDDLAEWSQKTTQIPERVSDKEQNMTLEIFTGIDDRIYFTGLFTEALAAGRNDSEVPL